MTNKNNNPNGKGGQKAGEPGRNPNGRPPNDKSFTNDIRRGGSARVVLYNGKKANRNKATSEVMWDAVLTGYLRGLDGEEDKVSVKERITIFQILLNRVDGMPRQALDISQTPEEATVTVDEMATAMRELGEWRDAQNGDE